MLNDIQTFLMTEFKKSKLISNFHDLNDETYKSLTAGAPADFPRLKLSLISVTGPLAASSSGHQFAITYDVMCDTSDETQKAINDILWEVICRTCYIQANKGIFLWKDERPIKDVELLDTPIGLYTNQTVPGFASVSKLRVKIHVSKNIAVGSECDCVVA